MSPRITFVTALRILTQLRHDPRTVALLVCIPTVLLVLIRFLFDARPDMFDRVGLILLGVLPFTMSFLLTSIAMLRERSSGTLERLLTTPLSRLDLLFGYAVAFAVTASLQSIIGVIVAYGFLGLETQGTPLLVGAIAVANAILGMSLGLFVSTFAYSEFQAVQFMPAIVMPQALLSGLFGPREQMVGWLKAISDVLPMTYAVDALTQVGSHDGVTETMLVDLAVIVAVTVGALALGATTLRRRTA